MIQQQQQPGSCDKCQNDPTRAASCRRLAETARGHRDSQQQSGSTTLSCSEFHDRVGGSYAAIQPLIGNQIVAQPNTVGGFDVEEQAVAVALATLRDF
jgi:hypothetical protein